jgi:uncharacterized protein YjbI with pentapeptide repeats
MTPRKQLHGRWNTGEGVAQAEKARKALLCRSAMTAYKDDAELGPLDTSIVPELADILVGFPYADEVAPALDLRGFVFDMQLRQLDLSNVRFDFAVFAKSIGTCVFSASVFDGAEAHQSLGEDFQRASFRKARFKRVSLYGANLAETDFTEASLRDARLKGASCRRAILANADLRESYCACADFRAADLSAANFKGATLGGVVFDRTTKLEGAVLTDASLSPDFREYALSAGAVIGCGEGTYPLRR